MGFFANGNYDKMLDDKDWQDTGNAPSFTNIYLKCKFMMDYYVCIGQIDSKSGKRISSDADPDIFFRSAILQWKPYFSHKRYCIRQ